MKLLILTFSILFLASCTQYRYDVTYEKCNGQTGSYIETRINDPLYIGRDRELIKQNGIIRNVCDFSYTSTPLQ